MPNPGVIEPVQLDDARWVAETWRHDYHHHRPHGPLGDITPAEAARRWDSLRSPTAPSANPSEILSNPGLPLSLVWIWGGCHLYLPVVGLAEG